MHCVYVCNTSHSLYLLHTDNGNIDASITNPHTSNAYIITARRMHPTQSARLVDVAVVRTERPPAGCITCEAMCDRVYIDTAVIMHVCEHDMQTLLLSCTYVNTTCRQSHRMCISCGGCPPRGRRPSSCCSIRSLRMPTPTYANLMRCGCSVC